jgi:hypothetical protein
MRELSPAAELRRLPEGSFVRLRDLRAGTDSAKRSAVSKAVKRGELARLHSGIYFKGVRGRFGMSLPRPEEIARVILGREGTGFAGYSAARFLGLTTQVPTSVHVATTSHVQETKVKGVTIHSRNNRARRELNETEIAILEVLRDPGNFAERGWASVVDTVRQRISSGELRPEIFVHAAREEHSKATRENLARLELILAA